MTSSRQDQVVAWFCGYVPCRGWISFNSQSMMKGPCGHKDCYPVEIGPAKYGESLDAMHGAEMKLTPGQQFEYHNHLFDLLPCDENHGGSGPEGLGEDIMTPSGFTMLHADAGTRRKAFLRTIGKWEE